MLNVQPQTDAGRAMLALADEFLSTVRLDGMLSLARPLIEDQARQLVEAVDRNPDAARAGLRPTVQRLVGALGFTAEELFAEAEA